MMRKFQQASYKSQRQAGRQESVTTSHKRIFQAADTIPLHVSGLGRG